MDYKDVVIYLFFFLVENRISVLLFNNFVTLARPAGTAMTPLMDEIKHVNTGSVDNKFRFSGKIPEIFFLLPNR